MRILIRRIGRAIWTTPKEKQQQQEVVNGINNSNYLVTCFHQLHEQQRH
jgi:hypothetical protein